MPSPDIRTVQPDPDSRWRCPCGYENTWGFYRMHRRYEKGNRACRGKGIKIYDPLTDEALFGIKAVETAAEEMETATPPTSPPPEPAPEQEIIGPQVIGQATSLAPELGTEEILEQEVPPDPSGYEYRGEDTLFGLPTDTEALARLYNQRRAEPPPTPGGGNGHGDDLPPGILGTVPPDADFALETSPLPPQVSQYRETVQVAPIARVIFDWARQQGWRVGDGSFSAFVMDVVLDHFWNCWNMGVYIVGREEIKIGRRTQ